MSTLVCAELNKRFRYSSFSRAVQVEDTDTASIYRRNTDPVAADYRSALYLWRPSFNCMNTLIFTARGESETAVESRSAVRKQRLTAEFQTGSEALAAGGRRRTLRKDWS